MHQSPIAPETRSATPAFSIENTKEIIRQIWANSLSIPSADVADESYFVDLGGHSLIAYQAAQVINQRFGVALRVSDLIGYATLAEIADSVYSQVVVRPVTVGPTNGDRAEVAGPLTASQRGQMHMIRLFETARPFTLIEGRRFEGITYDRLSGAVSELVDGTDAFWLTVSDADGTFVQELAERRAWDICFKDLRRMADPEAAARHEILAVADFEPDLGKPSFRVVVCQLEDTAFELVFVVPHVFFDGWSVELLFDALDARLRGEALDLQTVPGHTAETAYLDSAEGRADATYWDGVLAEPYEGALGRYLASPEAPTLQGGTIGRAIAIETLTEIRAAAQRAGCSVYSVVLSAAFVVLGRASGRSDLMIGTPAANRDGLDTNAVGCFANLLPIRTVLEGSETFAELCRRVQGTVGEAVVHQAYPYEKMVGAHGQSGGANLAPLFDVVFSHWSNAGKAKAARRSLHLPFAKYPLELIVQEEAEGLQLTARYAADLLDRHTAETILDAVVHVASHAFATLDVAAGEVPLMPQVEADRITGRHKRTDADWPTRETLVSLFEAQVAARPEAIAVSHGSTRWSYRELARRALDIADELTAKGAQRGDRVAVLMHRGPELIAAIMGVLRAGCAYVPIDVDHPADRQAYILSDSGARFLLQDDGLQVVGEASPPSPSGPPAPADLAYFIYTSGTTGQPKGVMIEHQNVVRLLYAEGSPFDFTPDDVWTMFHAHCFDVSVFELFGALSSGGRLVIVDNLVMRDPTAFRELLLKEGVTILRQTPTAFYNLLVEENVRAEADLSVRQVLFAGEALTPSRLQRWAEKYPECRLINLYGTTETTVDVTYHEVTAENIAANEGEIGGPVPTLSLYVLDAAQNPVPDGFVGELVVGGAGVGRGYCNKPELTAERFIDDPFAPGWRAYRTGDLARYTADGRLIYIGRNDAQVQVKGHRIEPEEVASAIRSATGVRDAFVHPRPDADGGALLVAYWIGTGVTEAALREHLAGRVPGYMVPAYFVQIAQLPTTINGKVNVRELPEPERTVVASERVAPRTAREAAYFDIFASALGTSDFGVTDSFFDLGGDSLAAVKAASLSNRAFRVMDLYTNPTVADLAAQAIDDTSLLIDLGDTRSGDVVIAAPFAGGSPADFLPVAQELGDGWRMLGVSSPGGGGGRSARAVTGLRTLARDVADEVARLNPAPERVTVLGYCVGVATALAIADEMRRREMPLTGVVMAAIFPPGFDAKDPRLDYWQQTSDAALRMTLGGLGLGDTADELPDALIADFRSDVRLYREFFFGRADGPLEAPTLLLFADDDPETEGHAERWREWGQHLTVDRCAVCPEGGHYFLRTDPGFVARALTDWTAEQSAPALQHVDL
ncbi:MAG: amino acid adenylation domain-containing protein [Pseudomonadota bacterium]